MSNSLALPPASPVEGGPLTEIRYIEMRKTSTCSCYFHRLGFLKLGSFPDGGHMFYTGYVASLPSTLANLLKLPNCLLLPRADATAFAEDPGFYFSTSICRVSLRARETMPCEYSGPSLLCNAIGLQLAD
eukprot:5014408-Amphidinium_carterae.1